MKRKVALLIASLVWSIAFGASVVCGFCEGYGKFVCSSCNGAKIVVVLDPWGNYVYQNCMSCRGYGFKLCVRCNGNGYIQKSSPSFTGNKYKCTWGGCLCRKYVRKGVFNSDCENCGHSKHD